ncbi:MAG: adenosine deaminase [Treponema sp.]|nr:adenosine deaminase [Treponema sp.]
MNEKDFYSLLKSVPKAELHIHEEAAIGKGTIKKLYKKYNGMGMPDAELNKLFDYNDLAGFLDSFIAIQNMFKKPEDLKYTFSDLANYLKRNNITYCETFFSPTSHIKKGFSFKELSKIITDGVEMIQKKTGFTVRIIVDVSRSFGLENAQRNLDYILEEKNPYIIGIGLGGDEEKGPAKDFESVFLQAEKAGLHRVTHAGEICPSFSIKDSINILHAERIGHSLTAGYDEECIKEMKEKKIPAELCPTSNTFIKKYITKIEQHPAKKLYDAGVHIMINTDDPTFFKVSLIDEYWRIYKGLNFSLDDIKNIIKNSFTAAFISDEQKTEYCKQVDTAWDQWFLNHPDCKI